MTLEDLKRHLERHGVPEDLYVIQELGIGEVRGIGFLDGRWCTYYSERGSYRQVQPYDTEEAAVDAFLGELTEVLRGRGVALPPPR